MESTRICIQLCVYVAFVAAVVTADQDFFKTECPGPLAYYRDLGCRPIYKNKNDNCAVRFDCNHIKKRSINNCYINHHVYKPNQLITSGDASNCDISCVCQPPNFENEIAAFRCSQYFSCPTTRKVKDGCYLRQNLTKCCKDPEEICLKSPKDRPVCYVASFKSPYIKEYLDGEYFTMDGDPDTFCICQPGYAGVNIPPFCIKLNRSPCNHPAFIHVDYFRQNCAPVYYDYSKMKTCYTKIKCQEDRDIVIRKQWENPFKFDNFNEMCTFGNLMMHIGDRLYPHSDYANYPCIDCICEVPPVLTCKYLIGNCNEILKIIFP